MSDKPSRPRLRLGVVLLLVSLIGACEQPPGTAEMLAEAERHTAAGDYERAIAALSQAIAQGPDDAALRVQLAELYLAAGQGNLAEVTAGQAARLGAAADTVARIHAEALLQQREYSRLLAYEIDPGLPPDAALAIAWAQLRARAALSRGDDENPALTAAYAHMLAHAAQHPALPVARAISAAIDAQRESRVEAQRAWAHHACRAGAPGEIVWTPLPAADRRVLRVGPQQDLKTPAAAARVARDGDLVEIDPGTYEGGVAHWRQNRLIVRGAGEGAAIDAAGLRVAERDAWLFTGDDIVVENVAIRGARAPVHRNGAGIRHTGRNLTLRNVFLHDNENGLLTGNDEPQSRVVVEFSEFAHNGDGEGYVHNIYVGRAGEFVLRFSYSHDARQGHLVKSRAAENTIAYNRISDEEGESSYLIDIPLGGSAVIVGNVLQHGQRSSNHAMIGFGTESWPHERNRLVIAFNTFYNRHFGAVVVRNRADAPIHLQNNLFAGASFAFAEGSVLAAGNLTAAEHGMTDPREFDFSLQPGAYAVDRAEPAEVVPQSEYVHPRAGRRRVPIYRLDVGAYERCGL